MLDLLKIVSFSRGVQIFMILFGVLLAPYWFLFQFAKDIYSSNNFIQIIMLSLAIGIPVAFVMFLIFYFGDGEENSVIDKQHNEYIILEKLAGSALFAAVIFYLPCLVKFFWTINQRTAIMIMLVFSVIAVIPHFVEIYRYNKKNK